jgi:hypothetical protein
MAATRAEYFIWFPLFTATDTERGLSNPGTMRKPTNDDQHSVVEQIRGLSPLADPSTEPRWRRWPGVVD